MKSFTKYFFITVVMLYLSSCADSINKYSEPIENILPSTTKKDRELNTNLTFQYSIDDLPTKYNPESDPNALVDELGLWMQVEKIEKSTLTAGNLVKNKHLNSYIKKVFCKVSPEYCNEIRIYIMNVPLFNAAMYPNGMMHIWTGALLRIQNEAQLANLIGHELAHYLKRHSYERYEKSIKMSGAATIGGILLGAAGLGNINNLLNFTMSSNIASYGRNDEREADGYGLVLMARAGYKPEEGSRLWKRIIETSKEKSLFETSFFLNTHPSPPEREKQLNELSKIIPNKEASFIGREEYISALKPIVSSLITAEIKHGEFESSLKLFNKLINDEFYLPNIYYARGEIYRTKKKNINLDKALENYKISEKYNPSAEKNLYKSIGLTYIKMGDKNNAKESFKNYITLHPDAKDINFIKSFMEKL